MPVYLCQPGVGTLEPWRHGIQVYAAPFALDDDTPTPQGGRDMVILPADVTDRAEQMALEGDQEVNAAGSNDDQHPSSPGDPQNVRSAPGMPIRRVRHAEIVLVDDVCVAFERYWLRLRWPGHKGGFAGYIALGKVGSTAWDRRNKSTPQEISLSASSGMVSPQPGDLDEGMIQPQSSKSEFRSAEEAEFRSATEEADLDDPTREDEPQDNNSTFSSEPFESSDPLTCTRTGLTFPSSMAMKLLAMYDDGIIPPVSSAPLPSEPVFCRICREGLHDDADDLQPAMEDGEGDANARNSGTDGRGTGPGATDTGDNADVMDPPELDRSITLPSAPEPHAPYQPNSHAAENPLLAPCECSGSMAFVHYLCIEQWRCRSRHPEAHHGLHCETCGSAYSLPPPSARPTNMPPVENEDWLEAMPPHVMAALRQPHIWWQIGAWIVRRRWLRPVAPVLMSPLVALYCRARRLLKKRGVARRRWACSLCRRRARWKCVRCLRSYYCSRQCQNVSWHIVHKHVCYKPARFWWSVVVYGVATLLLFPGILRDPLMYDLGLGLIPTSFLVMGILGGGIATLLKKWAGLDLRGRSFELVVVLLTIWLVLVSWGLVWGFFGIPSRCHGVLGGYSVSLDGNAPFLLRSFRSMALQPLQSWFLMWDRVTLYSGAWLRGVLCTPNKNGGCFEHLPHANADFFLEENHGERCASDLLLVIGVWISAAVVLVGSSLLKRRERHLRAMARRNEEPRPHQD